MPPIARFLPSLLLPALLLATAKAAEPQATPAQCLLPAQGGSAVPDKAGWFDLEKCLQKAGSPNFSRKGKTLTVPLANGKSVQFKDNRREGETYAAYTYAGYEPVSGLHAVTFTGYEWGNVQRIDHASGMRFEMIGELGISPDRQWALGLDGSGSIFGCERPPLAMYRIPARGQPGKAQQVPVGGGLGAASATGSDCSAAPAVGLQYVVPVKARWLAPDRVQIQWEGYNDPDAQTPRNTDSTVLTRQGEQWLPDHLPFSSRRAKPAR
ncbi:hypothetical protein [Chitinilyticum piscinae]|uniref:Uncharacterized protein n=1 Tax=Chitinilyticum piscinae TaxID=2866724 RepID=A0A8J7K1I5_9NEIS|nr:hypothetical protein [Chitinilyticum piscinae]MBE9609266.1 hypothetical protein [Chitinilyticum piscinae]